MKSNTTLVLLALVLLLGAFIWFVERDAYTSEQKRSMAGRALRLEASRVDYVRFRTDTLDLACKKDDGLWYVIRPVRVRADAGEIDRILFGLESLEKADLVPLREMKKKGLTLRDYGLETPQLRFSLKDDAGSRTFFVGHKTPLGNQVYVQEKDRKAVLVAEARLLDLVPASLDALRDHKLFTGTRYEVERLEVRGPSGFMQFSRAVDGQWKLQQPVATGADPGAVRSLLDLLYNARIERFIADTLSDPAAYGLDDSASRVSLWTEGKELEQTVSFGEPLEENPELIYARNRAFESVFGVSSNLSEIFKLKPADVRDRRVLPVTATEVRALQLEENGRSIELHRQEDGSWSLVRPAPGKADREQVESVIRSWLDARADWFVDPPITNAETYGFYEPARSIRFLTEIPSTSAPPRVALPKGRAVQISARPLGSNLVVRLADEPALMGVKQSLAAQFSLDPLSFRDRDMLSISPAEVRSLSLSRGSDLKRVEMGADGTFTAVGDPGALVDLDAVEDLLALLEPLRVDRYVDLNPVDLSLYGLDAPAGALTIGLSGESGIEKTLLLGNQAGGDGFYIMLRGGDVVALAPAALLAVLDRPWLKVPEPRVVPPVD